MLWGPTTRFLVNSLARRGYATVGCRVEGIHEPAYLEELKPKVGYYDLINVNLQGYDYVVLEKYQSYLHKTMKKLDMNVTRAWAAPHQELQLEILGKETSAIETAYKIKIYKRTLQTKNALVTKLPILIDIMSSTSPPGVFFNLDRHSDADDDQLYFKDSVLEKAKEELEELRNTPLIGA